MVHLKRPVLVWALLLGLVLVNGFMAVPSVSHEEHHADHQAGTHSTGICAWLCAAGQGVESSSVVLVSVLRLVEWAVPVQVDPVSHPVSFYRFLRGPPITSS